MSSSAEQILSLIVAFNIYFSFFNPIIHFLANSSSVTKWCFLFVIVAYPFLIIDNLIFPISLSTMRSWVNLIDTISIALSKSWMAMSSWVNITVGSQGVWLLTGLIYMRLNTIWSGNVSACLNLFICGVISNKSTCGSHCQHLDMGIKICIHSQFTVMIGRVSQIGIPKSHHWLGFIKCVSILLPNHNPWKNISIMTSPNSIVYKVAPVHIGIFTCSS